MTRLRLHCSTYQKRSYGKKIGGQKIDTFFETSFYIPSKKRCRSSVVRSFVVSIFCPSTFCRQSFVVWSSVCRSFVASHQKCMCGDALVSIQAAGQCTLGLPRARAYGHIYMYMYIFCIYFTKLQYNRPTFLLVDMIVHGKNTWNSRRGSKIAI